MKFEHLPGITVVGECSFKSFKIPIRCHGSSDPCVKYTFVTEGSKPPYMSFVCLILFSIDVFVNLKEMSTIFVIYIIKVLKITYESSPKISWQSFE